MSRRQADIERQIRSLSQRVISLEQAVGDAFVNLVPHPTGSVPSYTIAAGTDQQFDSSLETHRTAVDFRGASTVKIRAGRIKTNTIDADAVLKAVWRDPRDGTVADLCSIGLYRTSNVTVDGDEVALSEVDADLDGLGAVEVFLRTDNPGSSGSVSIGSIDLVVGYRSRLNVTGGGGEPPADDQDTPTTYGDASGFALGGNFSFWGTSKTDDVLAFIAARGTKWVRHGFEWDILETSAGTYKFNERAKSWQVTYDDRVARIDALGLSHIGRLGKPPSFYGGSPVVGGGWRTLDLTNTSTADAVAFRNFAKACAERYPQVTYWQIWNEANFNVFGRLTAAEYAVLMEVGYGGVKEGNPDALVMGGSLTPSLGASADKWTGTGAAGGYWQDVIDEGAMDWMDIASMHFYVSNQDPKGSDPGNDSHVYDLAAARLVTPLDDAGYTTMPIACTETGWTTDGGASEEVSEATKADYEINGAERFHDESGSRAGPYCMFSPVDISYDLTDIAANYGWRKHWDHPDSHGDKTDVADHWDSIVGRAPGADVTDIG